jgi:hypothetical protein
MPTRFPVISVLATTVALSAIADDASAQRPSPSPDAAIVLTVSSVRASSFEAAQASKIDRVKDGDPAFIHVKAPRPLRDYAAKPNAKSDTMTGVYPRLFLSVAQKGKRGESLATCMVTLLPEEAANREIALSIAPGDPRPGLIGMDCWLKAIAAGRAGVWENELLLEGFSPGTETRVVLAAAPLTATVAQGIEKYTKQFAQTRTRFEKGDPSFNPLPPAPEDPGHAALVAELPARLTPIARRRPTAAFYTEDGWTDETNILGRVIRQRTTAAAIFAQAPCGWDSYDVVRLPESTRALGFRKTAAFTPLTCDRAKAFVANIGKQK